MIRGAATELVDQTAVPFCFKPPQTSPHLPAADPKQFPRLLLGQLALLHLHDHLEPVPLLRGHQQLHLSSPSTSSSGRRTFLLCGHRTLPLCCYTCRERKLTLGASHAYRQPRRPAAAGCAALSIINRSEPR